MNQIMAANDGNGNGHKAINFYPGHPNQIQSKFDKKGQPIPFQPQINNFNSVSVNMLPSINRLDNRSPQEMGGLSGANFGSGKVGSNNGSSSGGSVFSGVGIKSGNKQWTLGVGNDSQSKMNVNSGNGLVLSKIRSGSSGGSFLSNHHTKGLKMSRQISG